MKTISNDPSMRPVVRLVLKAAVCRANVLLVGESGVGKTYIARRIHEASTLARGAFRTLFCSPDQGGGADTEALIRGLQTEEHSCGTLYVKNIDLLGALGQRRLLDYLDDRQLKVNASGPFDNDLARLIFSSERDLRLESVAGRFLRQLYLRLSVITIQVPPLRKRESDIVSLARHFLSLYSDREQKKMRGLSMDAESLLRKLSWEGNIHELRNAMNRAVVLADEGQQVSAGVLAGVIQQTR